MDATPARRCRCCPQEWARRVGGRHAERFKLCRLIAVCILRASVTYKPVYESESKHRCVSEWLQHFISRGASPKTSRGRDTSTDVHRDERTKDGGPLHANRARGKVNTIRQTSRAVSAPSPCCLPFVPFQVTGAGWRGGGGGFRKMSARVWLQAE